MTTMADVHDMVERRKVHPTAPVRSTTTVHAPCCGRRVAADMVEDLRGLEGTTIQHPRRGLVDLDFACDGCRERMLRDPSNDWNRAGLMRAQGYSRSDYSRYGQPSSSSTS